MKKVQRWFLLLKDGVDDRSSNSAAHFGTLFYWVVFSIDNLKLTLCCICYLNTQQGWLLSVHAFTTLCYISKLCWGRSQMLASLNVLTRQINPECEFKFFKGSSGTAIHWRCRVQMKVKWLPVDWLLSFIIYFLAGGTVVCYYKISLYLL